MGKKTQHQQVIQHHLEAPVVYSRQITIEGVNFIPNSEYERVVAKNIQLQQRVAELEGTQTQLRLDLANKDRELLQIKIDNERLQQRINHLEQENNQQNLKISHLEKELDTIKIYQKFSDSSKSIFSHMHDIFCSDNSDIRKQSQDTDLYHLYDHLIEVNTQKYAKWSRVKKDTVLWNTIYSNVKTLLQKECNINDINIFFEIIKLRGTRNSFSHQTSPITMEELKLISPLYYQDIHNLIES